MLTPATSRCGTLSTDTEPPRGGMLQNVSRPRRGGLVVRFCYRRHRGERRIRSTCFQVWGITRMSDADSLSADAVRVAQGAATPPRRATMRHLARRHGSSFRSRRNDMRMSSIRRFTDKSQNINRSIAGNRSDRKAYHGPPASSPEKPEIQRNTQ